MGTCFATLYLHESTRSQGGDVINPARCPAARTPFTPRRPPFAGAPAPSGPAGDCAPPSGRSVPSPLRVLPPLRIPRGESARRLAVKTWDRQRGRRARDGHWGAGAHYLSVRSTILCRLLVIAIVISYLIKS